jgi:hypothetical protein
MSEVPKEMPAQAAQKGTKLKNIALFFASPFIGLVYAVLLPGKVFQIAMSERKAGLEAGKNSK